MADTNRIISVQGAREHNLKNVSIELPRDALIVANKLTLAHAFTDHVADSGVDYGADEIDAARNLLASDEEGHADSTTSPPSQTTSRSRLMPVVLLVLAGMFAVVTEVTTLIEDLDQRAVASAARGVSIIQLKQMNTDAVQEALDRLLRRER